MRKRKEEPRRRGRPGLLPPLAVDFETAVSALLQTPPPPPETTGSRKVKPKARKGRKRKARKRKAIKRRK